MNNIQRGINSSFNEEDEHDLVSERSESEAVKSDDKETALIEKEKTPCKLETMKETKKE